MRKGRQPNPGLPVTRLHLDLPVDRRRGSKIHPPGSERGLASARQSLASSKPASLRRSPRSSQATRHPHTTTGRVDADRPDRRLTATATDGSGFPISTDQALTPAGIPQAGCGHTRFPPAGRRMCRFASNAPSWSGKAAFSHKPALRTPASAYTRYMNSAPPNRHLPHLGRGRCRRRTEAPVGRLPSAARSTDPTWW